MIDKKPCKCRTHLSLFLHPQPPPYVFIYLFRETNNRIFYITSAIDSFIDYIIENKLMVFFCYRFLWKLFFSCAFVMIMIILQNVCARALISQKHFILISQNVTSRRRSQLKKKNINCKCNNQYLIRFHFRFANNNNNNKNIN